MYPPRINELQIVIMNFISSWGKMERKPIPIHIIIEEITSNSVTETRVVRAVRGLVKKKYIRKALDRSSRSSYVQLKNT